MATIADIPRYAARVTVTAPGFGTFTQDTPLALIDCYIDPKAASKIVAQNLAKCAGGSVDSVTLIALVEVKKDYA